MSRLTEYDYELPQELVAQYPLANRSDARMLVVDRARNSFEHRHIRDFPDLLRSGDCLVVNDTRVVPARLVGVRTNTGGRWEGLFLDADDNGLWRVLSKTRGKLVPGESVTLLNAQGHDDVKLLCGAKDDQGVWIVRPQSEDEIFALLDRVGRVPLPPYIRKGRMVASDSENYQTVYARTPGAVAAPTAGLHFTNRLLQQVEKAGVKLCRLTLHVGVGTFKPIETDSLDEHRMHEEFGRVDEATVRRITAARRAGGRVVAVGTTSVRLLETAAAGQTLQPFDGRTDLFIRPPYDFHATDAILTNFHLPRTTLLVLVRAFGGDDLVMRAYQEAIRREYRFYSYGDAMLIL